MSRCTYSLVGRFKSALHAAGFYTGGKRATTLAAAYRAAKRGKHVTIKRKCNGVTTILARCNDGQCTIVKTKKARTSAYR